MQLAEVSKGQWDDGDGAFNDLLTYDMAAGSLATTDRIDTGRSEALQAIAKKWGLSIKADMQGDGSPGRGEEAHIRRRRSTAQVMEVAAYARCMNVYRVICEKGRSEHGSRGLWRGRWHRGAVVRGKIRRSSWALTHIRAHAGPRSRVIRCVGGERIDGYSDRYASQDLVASISFTGMDTSSLRGILACIFYGARFLARRSPSTGIAALFLGFVDTAMAAMLVLCWGIVPLLVFVYVGEYPKRRAAYMKVHSLGDVPEVISYIVMSMKLNPNIERAFKFAAMNSKRQLARDTKKLMWDLQIRAYDSMDDALDAFANGGEYSEHFKRAIFLIKSSTCEREEAMRTITLNRALDVVLQGTKGLMQSFSSSLHSPTLILYSIFVMVPLALVAMLPAAAIVGLKVNALELSFVI